jgi:hypothetical protein
LEWDSELKQIEKWNTSTHTESIPCSWRISTHISINLCQFIAMDVMWYPGLVWHQHKLVCKWKVNISCTCVLIRNMVWPPSNNVIMSFCYNTYCHVYILDIEDINGFSLHQIISIAMKNEIQCKCMHVCRCSILAI